MKNRLKNKLSVIAGIGFLALFIFVPYLIGKKDIFAQDISTMELSTTTGANCPQLQTDWDNCKTTARFTTKGDNCQKEYDLLKFNMCPIKFTSKEEASSCPQLQVDWDKCKGTDRYTTKGDVCQKELDLLRASNCPIDTGPCREGAIRNQMYCPSVTPLRAYRQYVCRSGKYVWEDVEGGEANCSAMEAQNCSDPDNTHPNNLGGGDRQIRSTTSGVSHGVHQSLSDFCAFGGNLVEHYCQADGVRMSSQSFSCHEGEMCQDGACVAAPPPPPPPPPPSPIDPTVLSSCGEPEGGWRDGTTYVLNWDIFVRESDPLRCFDLTGRDITLDCEGHIIHGLNNKLGVVVDGGANNITVRNCIISGFAHGITESSVGIDNMYRNNILANNQVGFSYLVPDPIRIVMVDNVICRNSEKDFSCGIYGVIGREYEPNSIRGRGNQVGHLPSYCRELGGYSLFAEGVYSPCQQ